MYAIMWMNLKNITWYGEPEVAREPQEELENEDNTEKTKLRHAGILSVGGIIIWALGSSLV